MRLIDADKLRKGLLMMECMEDVVEIIDEQPTAYDIDKVCRDIFDDDFASYDKDLGFVIPINRVFEIVKVGGKSYENCDKKR